MAEWHIPTHSTMYILAQCAVQTQREWSMVYFCKNKHFLNGNIKSESLGF